MSETPAAAPAAPAAPAPAPAAPAAAPAPAAPAINSLIPEATPAAPAPAAPAPAAPAPAAPAPASVVDTDWFVSEGVRGTGPAPDWYKADKYKSVAAQAEAYSHLEKRLGAFTGAPKDGKYEFKLPEGLEGDIDTEHPLWKDVSTMAAELQISNEGFNAIMGKFIQYEASMTPDPAARLADAKKELGDTADARIMSAAGWVRTNLGDEAFNDLRAATNAEEFDGKQIARVVKLVESAIAKTRVIMPKPGDDVPNQISNAQQEIDLLMAKKGPDGKALYFSDPVLRALVNEKRIALANAQGGQAA